jgi:hypothetical protein
MYYKLKHLNFDVGILNINDDGEFLGVKKLFIPERLPLGCLREDGVLKDKQIKDWWNERGIPVGREDYNAIMKVLGNTNKNKLLKESGALSLSDHYWIEEEKENKRWEDVNFYDNDFDREIGDLFFAKISKIYGKNTPDLSSGGNLKKRWEINAKGERVLIKAGREPYMQEPVNEEITTELCKRLNIKHVAYITKTEEGEIVCHCNNMTDQNTELVEAIRVYDVKTPSYFDLNNKYNHYIKTLDYLKVPDGITILDRMMVLDYIILNHDRHFRNFGVLRNSKNLNEYEAAPIYDSGSSLFHEDSVVKIKLPEYPKLRTECFDSLENQLDLVKDWSWLDLNKIKSFGDDCKNLLIKYETVEKARAEAIGNIINERINQLEKYLYKTDKL